MTAQPVREDWVDFENRWARARDRWSRAVGASVSDDGTHPRWLRSGTRIGTLSCREREVFCLLAQGYSNTEIGERLFITERTVRAHLTNMVDKLALRTRLEVCLLAAAYRLLLANDQLDPEEP